MNPYEVLGVSIDATPEEIKASYRKLATIHHPDKGGDVATFQEIAKAYDILINPVSRERYDSTGQTEKDDFGKRFHRFFNEILIKQIEMMPDVEFTDPLREFKKIISERRNQLIDAKKNTEKKQNKLEKILKRMKVKKKNTGILEFSINAHITGCKQLLGTIDDEIKFGDECTEVLNNYDYDSEKKGFGNIEMKKTSNWF